MSHLYGDPEWRRLLTAIALAPKSDDAPHLAAADWLDAAGEPLRAEYIRVSCGRSPSGLRAAADASPAITPLSGWVPCEDILCWWARGFVMRVYGALAAVRRQLPKLVGREPLFQTPDGPIVVATSDRATHHVGEDMGEGLWAWGNISDCGDETVADRRGPFLPLELFDLLPYPPIFDTEHAAQVALSTALLAEAHAGCGH